MALADALALPLGLPAYLVLDQLRRGVSPASILASDDSLFGEYRDARGYAYRWGNLIEARADPWLAWHFAPIELWQATDRLRQSPPHTVAALIPQLQPVVATALRDRLPAALVLAGCHPQSRRDAHVLFSLVLVDAQSEPAVRHWMAAVLLPRLLPEVLERVRAGVVHLCRTDPLAKDPDALARGRPPVPAHGH